jgi:hypothetical protein
MQMDVIYLQFYLTKWLVEFKRKYNYTQIKKHIKEPEKSPDGLKWEVGISCTRMGIHQQKKPQ